MADPAPLPSVDSGTKALITAAIAISWAVMVFMVRMYIRFEVKKSFGADDIACAVAMVLGVGSSAASLVGTQSGLGRRLSTLSPTELDRLFHSNYVAALLYIMAICASKCSTALLVARLKPARRQLLGQYWLTFVTVIWGVISTLIAAFICDLPRPWIGRCSHVWAKWTVIEVFSCLIECGILGVAVHVLWDLQMRWKSKALVLSILALRLLVVIPTGLRIYYLKQVTSVKEPTMEVVNLIITTQVLLHYTIMAATFPCLKPFLSAFEPELWEASYVGPSTLFRSRQTRDHKGYLLHSVEKDQNASTSAQISSLGESHRNDVERSPPASIDATVSGTMIIRKTQEWRVTHEMKP